MPIAQNLRELVGNWSPTAAAQPQCLLLLWLCLHLYLCVLMAHMEAIPKLGYLLVTWVLKFHYSEMIVSLSILIFPFIRSLGTLQCLYWAYWGFTNNNEQWAEVRGQRNLRQNIVQVVCSILCLTIGSTHVTARFTCNLLAVSGYLLLAACRCLPELSHLHRIGAELPHNS